MNPKIIVLIGGSIALTGIFASSYMTNFWAFIITYGVLNGIGSGIMYFIPLVCAWEWFPNKKGLITGIIVGSYGLGSFFFTLLATHIINPNNEKPTIVINKDLNYFDKDIANHVPSMFRTLVAIWTI